MNKQLTDLLPDHDLPVDVTVNGMTRDSRRVEPGNLFVAVPGVEGDGRKYIQDAITRNAAAVLYQKGWDQVPENVSVPVIGVTDLSGLVGELASRFFDYPSRALRVIAITGTNGKTSCSHFVAVALQSLGVKCGVIGTLGSGFPGDLKAPGLTTPESIEMQRILAGLRNEGSKAVAMEASSIGIDQGRLDGTKIDIAVLTNISRDHMDYHNNYEQYKEIKSQLFFGEGLSGMVLNSDDELGRELAGKLHSAPGLLTYSLLNEKADIWADGCRFDSHGLNFNLNTPVGQVAIKSPLIGEFNVSNLLALAGVLHLQQFTLDDIQLALNSVSGVKGRMEIFSREASPTVVIDYAHTPDALEKALRAIRRHCEGNLWCVFGCGGDRDKGKRPEMGQIAASFSDKIVVTDDNPRNESSTIIIEDILKGIPCRKNIEVCEDRREAIISVISAASANDWVLIAGKGHEEYQDVLGEKTPFSDHQVVRQLLEKTSATGAE